MAILDDFLRAQVQPLLRAGEALIGACYAMQITDRNALGTPMAFETWLLALAPTRMFLIQTTARSAGLIGFKRIPEPRALQVVEVPYDHVDAVLCGKPTGLGLGDHAQIEVYFHRPLRPKGVAMLATTAKSSVMDKREEPCGRCVVLLIPPSCEGLDGQGATWSQFPGWFEERVRTRAFPQSEATRAALAAEEAERARLAQEAAARQAQTRAARAAWWARNRHRVAPVALGAPLAIGAFFCGVAADKDFRSSRFYDEMARIDESTLREGPGRMADIDRRIAAQRALPQDYVARREIESLSRTQESWREMIDRARSGLPEHRLRSEEKFRGAIALSAGAVALGLSAVVAAGVAWRRLRPRAG